MATTDRILHAIYNGQICFAQVDLRFLYCLIQSSDDFQYNMFKMLQIRHIFHWLKLFKGWQPLHPVLHVSEALLSLYLLLVHASRFVAVDLSAPAPVPAVHTETKKELQSRNWMVRSGMVQHSST